MTDGRASVSGLIAPSQRPAHVAPTVTPAGEIRLGRLGSELPDARAAFERGTGHGLLYLGLTAVEKPLAPDLGFLRDLGAAFVARLCAVPELEALRDRATVTEPADLAEMALAVPPMPGAEYVDGERLAAWWRDLGSAFADEIREHEGTVQSWLAARHPAWSLIGRVCFHLAENRGDDEHPFAFLATYTTRLSDRGQPKHLPLSRALEGSSAKKDRAALLSLLVPVQRAAEHSPLVAELLASGALYEPLAWTPPDAFKFLKELPALEAAGVTVRVPDWWRARRGSRPEVTVRIGGAPPRGGRLDADALLDFNVGVTLDGEPLSAAELRALLAGSADGLVPLRGRWVEMDKERLRELLDHWKRVKADAPSGLAFLEGMRLLAGATLGPTDATPEAERPLRVTAGPWLAERLASLRTPDRLADADSPGLRATLRPYQAVGVGWLRLATELGLGVLLADDMGLGKTIQVIALLLHARSRRALLVVPASLIGNWQAELARFAPDLRAVVAHPSVMPADSRPDLDGVDLVITTYGLVPRLEWLAREDWSHLIVDEAQAIKNPSAKQTRALKALPARARIALTGTPVENRLGDLWSIFDFLAPGLLGSAREFGAFTKSLAQGPDGYAPLRRLLRPYILRRLKSDRSIVSDLPDKTELKAYCGLAPAQAALYQRAVDELAADLSGMKQGIERRGRVLAYLVRFKQICNHPAHWLGHGAWAPAESGKLARLAEIAETIAAKQEKALVFTQFREATEPLAEALAAIFGRPGLVLSGTTPVAKRPALVRRFQDEDDVPFMVLSVKAGGTGLNLTAAAHVVHFDRWWNPAVEDQATDRAYRIGQHKNVLVHKLVCRGTVEERIDGMLEGKKELAHELVGDGGPGERLLTEMGTDELLATVALDLRRATAEA